MKAEHKELIHDYLNLEKRISRIENQMERDQIEFYGQSLCGGTHFHPLGVRYKGFKIDVRVSGFIDLMNTHEKKLRMNKRKLKYFNHFLTSLDPHTRASLMRRYKKITYRDDTQEMGHDRIVLDEIVEIEEAISFEFRTDLSDELKRKAIEVEHTTFSENTVEDSFQTMQSLLGV